MEMKSRDHAPAGSGPGLLLSHPHRPFEANRNPLPWTVLLLPCGAGSGGNATHIVGAMVRWSSPYVIVHLADRTDDRGATPAAEGRTALSNTTPTAARVRELGAALSLNKTQLARVLRVSRPTIYTWLEGTEPEIVGLDRIDRLCRILERAGASSTDPLNVRFVRRAAPEGGPSLLELLSADAMDEPRVLDAIERVRGIDRTSAEERRAKEARLQATGFDAVDANRRRDQLAESVALRDWAR